MRLIRSRAVEWNIDPSRVGAIGFSAGGELVNALSARGDSSSAASQDVIERQRSRPDFQALIYPGRSGDIQPVKDSPPAFLACAYNDRTDISEGLREYLRFKRAGAPAESSTSTEAAATASASVRATSGLSARGTRDSRNGSPRAGC